MSKTKNLDPETVIAEIVEVLTQSDHEFILDIYKKVVGKNAVYNIESGEFKIED